VGILCAVVAILLVSALAAYEYIQANNLESQNIAESSTVASYSSEAAGYTLGAQLTDIGNSSAEFIPSWILHLAKLENGNATGALRDYASNATVMWTGDAGGWGGNFTGSSEIGVHLQQFFQNKGTVPNGYASFSPINLYLTVKSFNVTRQPNGTAEIGAALFFSGSSRLYGLFNGTVSSEYEYVHQSGGWLISQEHWNFETLDLQFGVGG
jgi:hypothetical protein